MNESIHAGSGAMSAEDLRFRRIEKAAAFGMLLFGYLTVSAGFTGTRPLAVSVLLILLYLGSAGLLRAFKVSLRSLWAPAYGILMAAAMVCSTGRMLHLAESLCSVLLWCYWVFACCGASERVPGADFVLHVWKAAVLLPLSAIGSVFPALFRRTRGQNAWWKTGLAVVAGLLLAVAPVILIVSLLRFDAGFSRITESLLNADMDAVFLQISHVILGIPVAMYCYGLIMSNLRGNLSDKLGAWQCAELRGKIRRLPAVTAFAMLIPILAVYALFFFSQIKYYVSAFSGVLPEGYAVADYARRGFFELCAVSGVNAAILAGITVFLRRRADGRSPAGSAAAILLSVVTLALIAIAASKLVLYIQSFGLTRLRVYSAWFMLLLGVCFTAVLVRQFVRKGNLTLVLLIVFAVLFSSFVFSNPDGWIARWNTEAYLSGRTEEIDLDELDELGASAAQQLLRLQREGKSEEVRERAAEILNDAAGRGGWNEYGFWGATLQDVRASRVLSETAKETPRG